MGFCHGCLVVNNELECIGHRSMDIVGRPRDWPADFPTVVCPPDPLRLPLFSPDCGGLPVGALIRSSTSCSTLGMAIRRFCLSELFLLCAADFTWITTYRISMNNDIHNVLLRFLAVMKRLLLSFLFIMGNSNHLCAVAAFSGSLSLFHQHSNTFISCFFANRDVLIHNTYSRMPLLQSILHMEY